MTATRIKNIVAYTLMVTGIILWCCEMLKSCFGLSLPTIGAQVKEAPLRFLGFYIYIIGYLLSCYSRRLTTSTRYQVLFGMLLMCAMAVWEVLWQNDLLEVISLGCIVWLFFVRDKAKTELKKLDMKDEGESEQPINS